jgi:hypothetical protein
MKKRHPKWPFGPDESPDALEGITPVVVLSSPLPRVPEETLQQELSGTADSADLWALFTIREDANSDVMLLSSTGSAVLDEMGLSAAKKWQFRAAKKQGKPVTSYLRLHIRFAIE